jgi:hypothetical protein
MAILSDTALAGADFDGTPGNGEIDFPSFNGLESGNDQRRALITSVGVSCLSDMATVAVRMASSKVQLDAGDYIEIGYAASSKGLSLVACHILVPNDWLVFVVTTGAAASDKFYNIDWSRTQLTTRLGGA